MVTSSHTGSAPSQILVTSLRHWDDIPSQDLRRGYALALESGKVLSMPDLAFAMGSAELTLLDPKLVDPKRKNISFNGTTGRVVGVAVDDARRDAIADLVKRYASQARSLVNAVLPHYKDHLHSPTTSLRLHRVTDWKPSWRKDDSRLHVDAFPSRPNHGERILRVFTNINPAGEPRKWRVGEAFPSLAERFLPQLKAPYRPGVASLMKTLGVTKQVRSEYDHLMLQMHDRMKADMDYQRNGIQESVNFAGGSSWMVFSDQAPHAAMDGQFMLEQTWFLPIKAMAHPEHAPLRVLERLKGHALV